VENENGNMKDIVRFLCVKRRSGAKQSIKSRGEETIQNLRKLNFRDIVEKYSFIKTLIEISF
jgi:hypothetical protein